jgi:hypothetical protein
MADVTITVNDTAVREMLSRAPAQIDRAFRGAMEDATVHLLEQMKTYPPQRAGSTYKRTNTLKGSWSRRITGRGVEISGVVGSNANVAPYNRLVQDATRQSRVHRGRWTNTVQAVSQRSARQINDMFANRIRAEIG